MLSLPLLRHLGIEGSRMPLHGMAAIGIQAVLCLARLTNRGVSSKQILQSDVVPTECAALQLDACYT
jgi:hypothetical protein